MLLELRGAGSDSMTSVKKEPTSGTKLEKRQPILIGGLVSLTQIPEETVWSCMRIPLLGMTQIALRLLHLGLYVKSQLLKNISYKVLNKAILIFSTVKAIF